MAQALKKPKVPSRREDIFAIFTFQKGTLTVSVIKRASQSVTETSLHVLSHAWYKIRSIKLFCIMYRFVVVFYSRVFVCINTDFRPSAEGREERSRRG